MPEETVGGDRPQREPEFAQGAKKYEDTVGQLRKAEPQPLTWKQKLSAILGAGVLGASGAAAHGALKGEEPHATVEPAPVAVSFHHNTDNLGEPLAPIFRENKNDSGPELSKADLLKLGIDISSPDVKIQPERGQTYSSQLKAGQMEDEKGRYGVWGEVWVGDKPTGIFASKNFWSEKPPEETNNYE